MVLSGAWGRHELKRGNEDRVSWGLLMRFLFFRGGFRIVVLGGVFLLGEYVLFLCCSSSLRSR